MCSLKGQNETAEVASLNTVGTSRRVKTIPRNTPRYSHDSLGVQFDHSAHRTLNALGLAQVQDQS